MSRQELSKPSAEELRLRIATGSTNQKDYRDLAYHLFAIGQYKEAILFYQQALDLPLQDIQKADLSVDLAGVLYEVSRRSTWTSTGIGLYTTNTGVYDDGMDISKGGYLFCSPIWMGINRSVNPVSASQVTANDLLIQETALHVYPNPSHDRIWIEGNFTSAPDLRITDINGRQVMFRSELVNGSFLISGLPSGVYIYTITHGESPAISGKLIIQ